MFFKHFEEKPIPISNILNKFYVLNTTQFNSTHFANIIRGQIFEKISQKNTLSGSCPFTWNYDRNMSIHRYIKKESRQTLIDGAGHFWTDSVQKVREIRF